MKIKGLLIVLFLAFSAHVFSQPLMTAKELKGKMKDENTIIVCASKGDTYAKAHINNSVNVYPFAVQNDFLIRCYPCISK